MSRDEKALGVRIDAETYGGVHDAVIALSGPPLRMTKKKLVTAALIRYLAWLTKKHNEGQSFKVQANRRLVGPGASNDRPVGQRTTSRVENKPGAGPTGGANGASAPPARARRRRAR